jgi:hypothetical protein
LLKARTVEAEKQLLLGNGLYTHSRGMCHTTIKEVFQAAFCGSTLPSLLHNYAALDQTTAIEEQVFSVGAAPRLFNEDLMQLE